MSRIKDEVRHRFQVILEQSNAHEKFRSILAKAEKETFLKAFDMACDRAYGKAPQSLDVTTREEISKVANDELERIAGHNGSGQRDSEESA